MQPPSATVAGHPDTKRGRRLHALSFDKNS